MGSKIALPTVKIGKYAIKRKRGLSGLGLFALEAIPKGEYVVEYWGRMLNDAEAQQTGGKYLFELSKHRTIDGSSRDNLARYINHACRPNCEIEIKKGRVLIFSKKAIKAGEELTYDYGKEYVDEFIKPYGCRCATCAAKKQKTPTA
ncbi:SET domain-containing protein [Patescibacteria group bacterium]|nr:SET domain-containing protein [Patescibacteria group bacterium]